MTQVPAIERCAKCGKERAELWRGVPVAEQRLIEAAGAGRPDWFARSHDAMPVCPPALVEAIRMLNPDGRTDDEQ